MSHPSAPIRGDPASPRVCLNCQAPLTGPYCAQCGQHDLEFRRSFHHLVHEALETVFHYDGKLLGSVASLLARPGRLTADFNAGRRQGQVPPLRFYIFVTVLFFFGVQVLNHGHLLEFDQRQVNAVTRFAEQNQIRAEQLPLARAFSPAQKAELSRRVSAATESRGAELSDDELNRIVAGLRDGTGAPPVATGGLKFHVERNSALGRALSAKIAGGEITTSELLKAIEQRVPLVLFLGMPLGALWLKLFYRRNGQFYIEHLIFSVHLHTWVFLAFMVGNGYLKLASFGPRWAATVFGWALAAWMIWYVVAAFRTVYGQSWRGTLARIVPLGICYLFTLLGLLALVMLAVMQWFALK